MWYVLKWGLLKKYAYVEWINKYFDIYDVFYKAAVIVFTLLNSNFVNETCFFIIKLFITFQPN